MFRTVPEILKILYLNPFVSSNINEVIKTVLNSLSFSQKDWHTLKALKSTKKRISDFLGAFFNFCSLVSVLCFFMVVKFLNKEVSKCPNDLIRITTDYCYWYTFYPL